MCSAALLANGEVSKAGPKEPVYKAKDPPKSAWAKPDTAVSSLIAQLLFPKSQGTATECAQHRFDFFTQRLPYFTL